MQRRHVKAAQKPTSSAERARESRARAVRAIVFMNRLFEYECRELPISLSQYRHLLYLRHGPKRAGELASQAAVTRPALSTLIASLAQAGLIKRHAVQSDKRGVRLEITRKGLETIERVEEVFGRVFDEAAAKVDYEGLVHVLGDVCRQLTLDMDARVRPDACDPDPR
jgi:DNA-binding MarR family transcriptional regulator